MASSPEGGRVFLCGTIHILRESDYPLPPAYDAAYAGARKLVFELPPGGPGGGDMNARMQKLAALPADVKLESIVGAGLADAVVKWASKHGVPASSMQGFQPWYLALMIAAVEYAGLGARPDKGVDNHFEARAERDQKPGVGLETVDFQISLFSRLSDAQQKELLEQTLAEVKTMASDFEKLLAAWKEGDLPALQEMLFREAERYPDLMDLFLFDRNQAWLGRLEGFLKKGEHVMVLVGAGHLAGKQGLVELLKARGYDVQRVHGAP